MISQLKTASNVHLNSLLMTTVNDICCHCVVVNIGQSNVHNFKGIINMQLPLQNVFCVGLPTIVRCKHNHNLAGSQSFYYQGE